MAPRFLDRLTKKRRSSRVHPTESERGRGRDDSAPLIPICLSEDKCSPEEPILRKRKMMSSLNGAVKRMMVGFKKLTTKDVEKDVDIPIMHSITFEPTVEMITTPEQELRYRGLRLDDMFQQFIHQCKNITPIQAQHISLPQELLQEFSSFLQMALKFHGLAEAGKQKVQINSHEHKGADAVQLEYQPTIMMYSFPSIDGLFKVSKASDSIESFRLETLFDSQVTTSPTSSLISIVSSGGTRRLAPRIAQIVAMYEGSATTLVAPESDSE